MTPEKLRAKRSWHQMSSNSYMESDWQTFAKDFKSFIKKMCKDNNWKLHSSKPWHYYMYMFIEASNWKIVYINTGDFRTNNFMSSILYRTAEHTKDYTGWNNNRRDIFGLEKWIERLFLFSD